MVAWRSRWLLVLIAVTAFAQGPENVLVVVNDGAPVSRSIGEYYARRRGIPQGNVCHIRTNAQESTTREAFDREIRGPVAECLRTRGLTEKVLYIATTLGVPLRIPGSSGPQNEAASVDSELTLVYGQLKGAAPRPAKGMQPNPFFNQRSARFQHPAFPIYLVTRLAAYDFAGVKAIIDKALIAKNQGKFVIDMRSGSDEQGENWLRNAAIQIPASRVVFEESSKVLYDQRDVIAYASWGSNDKNRKKRLSGFSWLPGAIATEYVSTDGRTFEKPPDNWNISDWSSKPLWFFDSPQSMTADFLMEGATGASGHVDEPYLMATPHPDLLLPAYYSGRNLAESYYLAIPFLSWQNIVIGDPLCSLGPPKP